MSQSRLSALMKLKKIRQTEVDQAKEHFAQSLSVEREIETSITERNEDIVKSEAFFNEKEHDYDNNDKLTIQSSYSNWVLASHDFIKKKEEELENARERTEQIRQDMVKANTALEATEKLIALIKGKQNYLEAQKIQNEIDDIARNNFLHRKPEIS